jgi:hypothetical protein
LENKKNLDTIRELSNNCYRNPHLSNRGISYGVVTLSKDSPDRIGINETGSSITPILKG